MPDRIKPTRGKRRHFIKEWRKRRGLTLEQLAERVGSSKGHISEVERFITGYTQDFLEACAEALNVEAAVLLRRPSEEDDSNFLTSIWSSASAEEKNQLRDMAEIIVRRPKAERP